MDRSLFTFAKADDAGPMILALHSVFGLYFDSSISDFCADFGDNMIALGSFHGLNALVILPCKIALKRG